LARAKFRRRNSFGKEKPFTVWSTFPERKRVNSGERRGPWGCEDTVELAPRHRSNKETVGAFTFRVLPNSGIPLFLFLGNLLVHMYRNTIDDETLNKSVTLRIRSVSQTVAGIFESYDCSTGSVSGS
jgi:hypothetical protein